MDTLITVVLGFAAVLFLIRLYFKSAWGKFDEEVDLTGKTAIISGANSGIGKGLAVELAKRNARVILACRSILRGEAARMDIVAEANCYPSNVVLKILDLSSLESVRKFANQIVNGEDRLDILINNAGAVGSPITRTDDGMELTYQTNHFGHFLLTNLLLDLMKESGPNSRIVNVSSFAHKMGDLDLDYVKPEGVRVYQETLQTGRFKFKAPQFLYNNSKLMNVMFTAELARRLGRGTVTVNCLNPGVVRTNILSHSTGILALIGSFVVMLISKNLQEGCQTALFCALSRSLRNVSGKYFSECKEDPNVHEMAKDEAACKKLWQLSEEMTGLGQVSGLQSGHE